MGQQSDAVVAQGMNSVSRVCPLIVCTILILSFAAFFDAVGTRAGDRAAAQSAQHMCPMHPDVRGKAGDVCAKCGMALVPATLDYHPYHLDVDLTPRALRPGERGRARFVVRDPASGAVVKRFEPVHERVFHLFIVSRDLEFFAHVHPSLHPDGSLDAEVVVPRAGAYQLIADFLPSGGSPQFVQRAFATAHYQGSFSQPPALVADVGDKIERDMTVHLVPPDVRAGREQLLTFELRDRTTDAPITDLEPFLGATGHLLATSADLAVAFHSHPVGAVSSPSGPNVVFQILFPRPGTYRLWAQFQRAGRVTTVRFTVPVAG